MTPMMHKEAYPGWKFPVTAAHQTIARITGSALAVTNGSLTAIARDLKSIFSSSFFRHTAPFFWVDVKPGVLLVNYFKS
jgi:hypothetical protein